MEKKKRRKLKNLKVEYVSYVDRGANQRTFYLTKEYEQKKKEPDFSMQVKLICSDKEEERKVYGLVYAPDVVDAHGDYTDADTLERAAHDFMLNYQKMDVQHNFEEGAGEVVESFIAPETFTINGEEILKGSWVLVSIASEEVWEAIKRGEITGYSLYGTAEVEYERMSLPDLIGTIFSRKHIKIDDTEIIIMDEKMKKALESVESISEKVESNEAALKSLGDAVEAIKERLEKSDKSIEGLGEFIEKINVEEVTASFENVKKKLDDLVEAVSNQSTRTESTEKQEDQTVEMPSMI